MTTYLIIQSIIVYGIIIWTMNYYGEKAYEQQFPYGIEDENIFKDKIISFVQILSKPYFYIPIFIYCIFSAIRYNVGVDSVGIKEAYYNYILGYNHDILLEKKEYLYNFILEITTNIFNTHYIFFFILAFLQISFIYFALRKKTYALLYIGYSIMLSFTYHSFMNGVRQNIVACIFVATIPLILKKEKWIWFLLTIVLASLMHKSALFLIPIGILVYLFMRKGIPNIGTQLAVIVLCFIFMDSIDTSFFESFFALGAEAGYEEHAIEAYSELEETNKSFGFFSILLFIVQLITVLYSKRMKSIAKDEVFNVMYNLFFISIAIELLFYNNFTIERLNYYFKVFMPIMISIMLYTTSNSTKINDKYVFRVSVLLLIICFLYQIYKVSLIYPHESVLYKFDIFQLNQ